MGAASTTQVLYPAMDGWATSFPFCKDCDISPPTHPKWNVGHEMQRLRLAFHAPHYRIMKKVVDLVKAVPPLPLSLSAPWKGGERKNCALSSCGQAGLVRDAFFNSVFICRTGLSNPVFSKENLNMLHWIAKSSFRKGILAHRQWG
jgi:hypothetical protein